MHPCCMQSSCQAPTMTSVLWAQTAEQNAAYSQNAVAQGEQGGDAPPKKRPRGRPLGSKTKVRVLP